MHNAIINRNDLHLLRLLPAYPRLCNKLARASVIAANRVPDDVVTMNSKIKYRDEALAGPRYVKLVYPSDADDSGRVSVLSPLGATLLGLSVGQEAIAHFPGAGPRRIRVERVVSQPEGRSRKGLDRKLEHAFAFSLGF
jgi:regulator of nucleoside diphosphate kinase